MPRQARSEDVALSWVLSRNVTPLSAAHAARPSQTSSWRPTQINTLTSVYYGTKAINLEMPICRSIVYGARVGPPCPCY